MNRIKTVTKYGVANRDVVKIEIDGAESYYRVIAEKGLITKTRIEEALYYRCLFPIHPSSISPDEDIYRITSWEDDHPEMEIDEC